MIKKINASVMEIIVLHKFLHDEIEENINSDRGYPAIVEALMIKNYKLLTPTMREIEKEKMNYLKLMEKNNQMEHSHLIHLIQKSFKHSIRKIIN